MNAVMNFVKDEDGVTMVEYGLIAALIAVVCIAAVKLIGDNLNLTFTKIGECLATPAKCVTAP